MKTNKELRDELRELINGADDNYSVVMTVENVRKFLDDADRLDDIENCRIIVQ